MEEAVRPSARGKFLWRGDEKLYVRGVTYGTFRPGEDGVGFPPPEQVEEDFARMAAAGFNTIRTYTVPPCWLLDVAERHNLLAMVGIPWEQHIAFLDEPERAGAIEERVREGVRACAAHPAILAYTIGNEIPASIVRWHGRRAVEQFLERLYLAAKDEDPEGLVTYVNFPTTEYLDLPFLDICAFNVYLETEERLEAYLARLQVVADERPLVMAEIGLDSRGNGEEAQAASLRWQLRTVFRAGCAGAVVFAWTDEWHRGGFDVEDWDFGLVRRDRTTKPALEAVRETLAELPLPPAEHWPRFSVVVCSYNGSATIGECMEAARAIDYPDYEVIVVDDGSTDDTADIARSHGAQVITTPNRGLSSARNTGAQAATGEIVAFCDDDAAPDPHWLTYLATTYATSDHVAVGGPNVAPSGDGTVADCVAHTPGNASHVLLSDTLAEHIPGCNSSFRRSALLEVGGFDPQFRVAGDDVDLCWRLQERGWTIGFSPAAMVWHHRRGAVSAFWRQQRGYGQAEAMLERKWPEKYNVAGHVSWAGRVYASGGSGFLGPSRVYYGTWGSGLFQRLYTGSSPQVAYLPLMPEWFLLIAALAMLSILGAVWTPLLAAIPVLGAAIAILLGHAWTASGKAMAAIPRERRRPRLRLLTTFLFVLQSLARLHGRLAEGLRPRSRRAPPALRLPRARVRLVWSETWRSAEDRLREVEHRLRNAGVRVIRGGDFDRWDLDVRGGMLSNARIMLAVEEHGGGRQQLRFRIEPRLWVPALVAIDVLVLSECAMALGGSVALASILGGLAVIIAVAALAEMASAIAASEAAVDPPAPSVRALATDRALLERIDGNVDGDVAILQPDPVLLPISVAENIALGRPGASFEEVRAAASAAGADALIERLSRGYDTLVGRHGAPLSDELRHRLAIAQMFLQDPSVLILTTTPDDIGNGYSEQLREPIERLVRGRRTFVVDDRREPVEESV